MNPDNPMPKATHENPKPPSAPPHGSELELSAMITEPTIQLPAIPPLSSSDLLCCSGCGAMPVDIGNMGRVKYVCPTYQSRSPRTTPHCDGGQMRPMWHQETDARDDWNEVKQHRSEERCLWKKIIE